MRLFIRRVLVILYWVCQWHSVEGQAPGPGPACTGQVLGEPNPGYATATAGTNTGTSYLLLGTSMKIPCCGVVSEWRFRTLNPGDLTAQVWKQVGGNVYQVVGETAITGVASSSSIRNSVGTTSQISVEKGYVFGWHSSGADIVPYITDASAAMGIVSSAGKNAVGATNMWSNSLTDGQQWQFGVKLSPNSPPYFTTLPLTVNAKVSDAVGTVLHTVAPTDSNPDDIAGLTVSIKPAMPEFELVGKDVKIKSTLAVNVYKVVLEVVDHCLQTGTATLTVSVTDNAPVITSLPVAAPQTLREDTLVETLLHTLTYTDVDTPLTDVTCSIKSTSPSPAPFALKYKSATSAYGVYFVPSASNPLNYDVVPSYNIYVVCNDGVSNSTVKLFQVDLVKNEDPVPTIPTSIDVSAETTKNGTIVYKVTATDASPNPDKLNFTMSNCSCPFLMTPNGEIYATKDLNAQRTTPYVVNITVFDGYNTVGPIPMTIKITDINTPPNITNPTQTLPKIDTVHVKEHTDEGTPNLVGTTVSVFTATSTDKEGDTLTWEIDYKNGLGEDLFDFDPATGEITTKTDLDYETLSREGLLTTTVYLKAWDGREYSETRALQIVVDDVNEEPVFAQNKYAIETTEGSATAMSLECPLFDVIDEDNYDTRTYDINCGTVGLFHIPATRTATCDAFIEQTAEFDLDSPGKASQLVSCLITVTDKGGLTATTTLEITVREIDDNPPVLDKTSYTYTIPNDTTAGATFGKFSSTDKDFLPEHKRVTYTTDSSEFGADANGVFFSKKDWTSTNAPTSRTFNLIATDEAGHTDTSPVTINIIDVPPVTTTTPAPTTLPSTYDGINSFLDDPGNLAWLIPAVLLGAGMLGLMGYMCFRCCASPGACANVFRGGNCFGRGSRGMRGRGMGRTVVRQAAPRRVVSQPRTIRVIEEPRRMIESRPIKEPLPRTPVKQAPPNKESSFFDCFKKKPTPKPVDEPKQWHLWNHTDFQSPQKWVG